MKVIKAFSMLEIVLVLAVLAILMGLGWTGLINFRSTAETQNAYSELVSVIKTIQNRANNSVSSTSTGVIPDFYVLFFSQNKYYSFNCCYNSSCSRASASTTVRCTKDTTLSYRQLPADIRITPDSNCAGIGFGKLNGKFTTFSLPTGTNLDSINSFGSTISQNGTCNITLSHNLISSKRTIEFNLNNNSLNVQK